VCYDLHLDEDKDRGAYSYKGYTPKSDADCLGFPSGDWRPRGRLRRSSWIYLFGWIAVAMQALPRGIIRAWALGGLVVYGGPSATWFADLDPLAPDPSGTAWAIDLILLGFNLAIAARVLMWEPS
jgi:hypothetical protein